MLNCYINLMWNKDRLDSVHILENYTLHLSLSISLSAHTCLFACSLVLTMWTSYVLLWAFHGFEGLPFGSYSIQIMLAAYIFLP